MCYFYLGNETEMKQWYNVQANRMFSLFQLLECSEFTLCLINAMWNKKGCLHKNICGTIFSFAEEMQILKERQINHMCLFVDFYKQNLKSNTF